MYNSRRDGEPRQRPRCPLRGPFRGSGRYRARASRCFAYDAPGGTGRADENSVGLRLKRTLKSVQASRFLRAVDGVEE